MYAAYCDLIKVAIESETESVPLSKSFPAPNYKKLLESGIESWKVNAVRALLHYMSVSVLETMLIYKIMEHEQDFSTLELNF